MLVLTFLVSFTTSSTGMNTFYGTENSYARYSTWQSSSKGGLTFTFRTTEPGGLLLYADDQYQMKGNGNFLKLKLSEERLIVQIQISYNNKLMSFKSEGRIFILGSHLNDNREHIVEIQRQNRHTTINLDGEIKTYTSPNEMLSLNINSSVFLGGIPTTLNTVWIDNNIFREKRFIGCLGKLRYYSDNQTFPSSSLIEGKDIEKGCQDKCLSKPTLTCLNGGKCLNMYVKTGCGCRGTGLTGITCQQPANTITFSNADSYLTWTPEKTVDFSQSREIMMRFKNNGKPGGVLMYATDGKEKEGYFSIELKQGNLVVTTSNKGRLRDQIKIDITASSKSLWLFLHIFSNTRYFSMKLHDGFSRKDYREVYDRYKLNSRDYFSDFKKIFIGGGKNQTGFVGCMQDIVVNQVDLLEILSQNAENAKIFGASSAFCNDTLVNQSVPSVLSPFGVSSLDVLHQKIKNEENFPKIQGVMNNKHGSTERPSADVWMIVTSVCCIAIVIVTAVVSARYLVRKRYKQIDRYTEHILRRLEVEQQPRGTPRCLREQNQHLVDLVGYSSQPECGYALPRSNCMHQYPNVLHHQHPFFEQNIFHDMNISTTHAQIESPCKRNRNLRTDGSDC